MRPAARPSLISSLALCLLVSPAFVAPARAEGPAPGISDVGKPEKRKDIRRLLDLTGAGQLGMQVMSNMIPQFKQMLPNVPEQFWADFAKKLNPNELVDLVVPIYDRQLSHGDIKQIIAFYQSPAGKRLVAAQPQITQESMDVGREWGAKLGQKVQDELKAKGYQK